MNYKNPKFLKYRTTPNFLILINFSFDRCQNLTAPVNKQTTEPLHVNYLNKTKNKQNKNQKWQMMKIQRSIDGRPDTKKHGKIKFKKKKPKLIF